MKKVILVSLLALLTACAEQSNNTVVDNSSQAIDKIEHSDSVQVTDFKGRTVRLERPARRIVALAPHIVENVFTAGAGKQLIGVVAYSDHPPEAKSLPIVGGYAKTNLEKILELKPDLVIAWESGNSDTSVARIQELGFPVYIDQPDKLEDVAKSITDIGVLAGTSEVAQVAAADYQHEVETIRAKKLNQDPVSAFYQVWNSPLRTINGNHIISDAIALCGGTNIFGDESAIAPIVNIESILERDPEAIIASGMSDSRPDWLDQWEDWPSLTAVKSNNLFFVNPDHIQRHTVRILEGIKAICGQLDQARAKRPARSVNDSLK